MQNINNNIIILSYLLKTMREITIIIIIKKNIQKLGGRLTSVGIMMCHVRRRRTLWARGMFSPDICYTVRLVSIFACFREHVGAR